MDVSCPQNYKGLFKPDYYSKLNDFNIQNNEENHKYNLMRWSFLYIAVSYSCFGFTTFHIKLTKKLFPDEFSAPSYLFYRNIILIPISLYFLKSLNVNFTRYSEIKNKNWFFIRLTGNYFAFVAIIKCMMYLRVSTAQCLNSMHPAFVLIISAIILKEKFYKRYVYGIIICFIGSVIIIMNENEKAQDIGIINEFDVAADSINFLDTKFDNSQELNILNIFIGSLWGILNSILVAHVVVGIKILSNDKIPMVVQNFFLGINNTVLGLIHGFLIQKFSFNIFFGLVSSSGGIIFYISNYLLNKGYENLPISKTTPLAYISTLSAFILSVLFLGENLYVTDIIGSLLILVFNVYNAWVPPK